MNIVIPLAGKDQRFESQRSIRPLITINDIPLIQIALDNLNLSYEKLIFICLWKHEIEFKIGTRLKEIFGSKIDIVWTRQTTEGALCSVLLAENIISTKSDLLIYLADTIVQTSQFKKDILNRDKKIKGIIPVDNKKIDRQWGYVIVDRNKKVIQVTEKEIIPSSQFATMGLYYFSSGRNFIIAARELVKKNQRINNLFYISPVYNQLIANGDSVVISYAEIKAVLDSPENIQKYKQLWQN